MLGVDLDRLYPVQLAFLEPPIEEPILSPSQSCPRLNTNAYYLSMYWQKNKVTSQQSSIKLITNSPQSIPFWRIKNTKLKVEALKLCGPVSSLKLKHK